MEAKGKEVGKCATKAVNDASQGSQNITGDNWIVHMKALWWVAGVWEFSLSDKTNVNKWEINCLIN